MNPRQRRLRRQRRKARAIVHEQDVESAHEELRKLARLAAQADAKLAKKTPPVGAALFAATLATLPKPARQ